MKTALVYDWLIERGGGERTLEVIAEIYPAPLYTLICDRSKWQDSPLASLPITTSFLQKFPLASRWYRMYAPFFPLAVEQWDLSAYDVVLSVSHAAAKGVLTHAHQCHLCYCFTPMRYAWDLTHTYLSKLGYMARGGARLGLHYLRQWDSNTAMRVDQFAAISHWVAARIRKIYGREATVIYPPVDTHRIPYVSCKEDFFVTASRMVPYKQIDRIVEAFAYLPDQTLVVIGAGPEWKNIQKKAGANVCLMGHLSDEQLYHYLGHAKGFIFAAEEDFGIIPVEAQAAGTPVIAWGRGGVRETVIENKTGLFFPEPTVSSIIEGVTAFLKREWDYQAICQHAQPFGRTRFQKEFREFLEGKIGEGSHLSRR